jgi:glycosyltransferase involved in cell wall biosynthesis
MTAPRKKVAILVNTIAPYRIPLYRRIGEVFDAYVLPSGAETNRANWGAVERELAGVTVLSSAGVTHGYAVGGQEVYEERYFHAPLGNIVGLFRTRPDALVTNEMGVRTLIALLYGTIMRKPVRIWWGGTLHTERNIGLSRRLLRRLISRWAKRWISYGATSTEYLLSLGIPRSRILQIQNCVDETRYWNPAPAAVDESSRQRPVLLFVGRMVGLKGVDKLLRVTASLQREGWRFSLLLVGDGPEKAAFEALVRQLNLTGVEFLPERGPGEMPEVYRSADFLVFPTLNDVWGLVVNEALWSGVPVLASRYAGSASELLPAERIFDPLDADDFAGVLRAALDGRITGADSSPLKRCAEVADMIVAAIEADLAGTAA